MIDKQNVTRRYNWSQLEKETRNTRWSSLYVSLNARGFIWLSRLTHEAMGSPDAYVIVHDPDLNVLGLQTAKLNVTKNAYPIHARGPHGGQVIHAHKLIRDFNLFVSETMYFPRAFIDHSGTLILELNDVRPATKK